MHDIWGVFKDLLEKLIFEHEWVSNALIMVCISHIFQISFFIIFEKKGRVKMVNDISILSDMILALPVLYGLIIVAVCLCSCFLYTTFWYTR